MPHPLLLAVMKWEVGALTYRKIIRVLASVWNGLKEGEGKAEGRGRGRGLVFDRPYVAER
jgi:hypothetical protein